MSVKLLEPTADEALVFALKLLSKDLRKSAKLLSDQQVRYLVDSYYQLQELRKAVNNRKNQAARDVQKKIEELPEEETEEEEIDTLAEPTDLVAWLGVNLKLLEEQIKSALHVYAANHPVGAWCLSIHGIGPVISAGMLAYAKGFTSISGLWRFAGYDPTSTWEAGEKRPWNARLKVLCWKAGDSFVKVSNKEKDFYGKFYKERKALEIERNERGDYKEIALAKAAALKKSKKTSSESYKHYCKGKLPPAHIHARAQRYATKLFLSHFAAVRLHHETGQPYQSPWIIAHGGHVDYIPPPNT